MKYLLTVSFCVILLYARLDGPVYVSLIPVIEEAQPVYDAVCNKLIDTHAKYKVRFIFDDVDYYFCDEDCLIEFNNNTLQYIKAQSVIHYERGIGLY